MSLHRSTHSSPMNTDGPAMILRTSCCLFPQNEQYSNLPLSSPLPFLSSSIELPLISVCQRYWLLRRPGLIRIRSVLFIRCALIKHRINQAVLFCLNGIHKVVTIGIFCNGFKFLTSMLGQYGVQSVADFKNFPGMN